jgi:hypothetical protein
MNTVRRLAMRSAITGAGLALTPGSAPATAAPAVEATPYRPLPPNGAAYVMDIPPVASNGVRHTLNMGLDEDETIWHVRSGWNVAALNCLGSRNKPILTGYATFLKTYARPLAAVNTRIEAKFRAAAGSPVAGRVARERSATQLYNYFATPAAIGGLCTVALAVAEEWLRAPPRDLAAFARATLPRYDAVYLTFFNAYDRYRADSVAWDAKYGELYGSTQPGYVAVHGRGR